MFGKKLREKEKEAVTMNPNFQQDDFEGDLVNQAFNQYQNPQLPQPQLPMNTQNQGYQQSMMHQQQSFQPPRVQFQPMSKIIKSELTETEGEFVYVIVTNYPLKLGDCQLTQ